MAILFRAVVCALLSAWAAVSYAQGGDLQLVDTTDEFARIWDSTASLPDVQRAAVFKAEFAKVLPGFYDHRRFDGMTEAQYDERLLKGLKAYPEQRAGIARVSKEFSQLLAPAQASFEKAFGPMRGYPPIYLVDSFGEFDGGTRNLAGGEHLMFGADMIDKLYKTTPIQPFFHHELFHLYHGRTFGSCDPLWCSLWTEGLAVYVASKLNPDANDASLLLTFPVPLRAAVENDRTAAICSVAAKLDSTDSADYPPLFQGRPQPGAKFPPRYGYYVGYIVAQDLGRNRSLEQLAALTPAQAEPLIKASLRSMADCPAPPVKESGERG
jgi:hypothetical protein